MNEPARFDLRVRFYELDPYGHVNHATYLQYFEAARVEWLAAIGHGLDRLLADQVQLVVTAVAVRFVAPAVLGDTLTIETGMVGCRRVQAQWAQRALRDGELIASQRINFATVNSFNKPVRIPGSLVEAMAACEVDESWAPKALPDLAF